MVCHWHCTGVKHHLGLSGRVSMTRVLSDADNLLILNQSCSLCSKYNLIIKLQNFDPFLTLYATGI